MKQLNFNDPSYLRNSKRKRVFQALVLTLFLIGVGHLTIQWAKNLSAREVDQSADGPFWKTVAHIFPFVGEREIIDPDYVMPAEEPNRLDILLLGLRGKDDPDGGLLTDTIMLFSFDRQTKKSTLVSIPRDLYVKIKNNQKDKANSAYEYLGLGGTKKLFSKVTGVYIDHAAVFDFAAFKKIIDDIGGVDIVLEKPFEETTQWGYVFSLPTGANHLNGEEALYYVRSRYSSSDFDRARRQQQVLFAIRDKVKQTDFLSDPLKALALINTLRSNITTDINILDVKGLIQLAEQVDAPNIKRYVLSPLDLLYDTKENGVYVLLPKGDTFEQVKTFFREILI